MAIRSLLLTIAAQTLHEAIVVVAGVMVELDDLNNFERTREEVERTVLAASRSLAGLVRAASSSAS